MTAMRAPLVLIPVPSSRAARIGNGFTLIELMVVVSILGIILAIAAPSFKLYFEKYRAKRAAETINALFVNARSEAIKRNQKVYAVFKVSDDDATWCIGLSDSSNSCNCHTAGSCQIDSADRIVDGDDFHGVLLTNPANNIFFTFDPVRGTTTANNATVQSEGGKSVKVVLSGLGRIKLCSPDSGMGHPAC